MRRYYDWKFDLVRPYLGNRVIEVGCGTGLFLERMAGRSLVLGIDREPSCIERAMQRSGEGRVWAARVLDVLDQRFLELRDFKPDTVLFMSSLEEIADDV